MADKSRDRHRAIARFFRFQINATEEILSNRNHHPPVGDRYGDG